MAEPLEARWIIAISFVVACTIWLGMAAFSGVDYSSDLWWQFDWHDDASRALRGSLAAVVVGAAISLYALIHSPAPAEAETPEESAIGPALDHAARADAHLAYLTDKRYLFHPEGDAFLMYAVRGKSWVVMGDPYRPSRPGRRPDVALPRDGGPARRLACLLPGEPGPPAALSRRRAVADQARRRGARRPADLHHRGQAGPRLAQCAQPGQARRARLLDHPGQGRARPSRRS